MNIGRSLLKISRPRFWLYLIGPILIGWVTAAQSLNDFNNIWLPILLMYFLIPANFYLYGLNDLFDLDTDIFNPKKENQEIKLIDAKLQNITKRLIIIFLLLAIPLVLMLPNNEAAWILIIFFGLGSAYSVPPLRFKARILIDSISNILYALPGIATYVLVSQTWPTWPSWLAILTWTTAMQLFSAIFDIQADKKAGLRTTAVLLGEKMSLYLCFFLWLIFALTTLVNHFAWPINILFFIYPLIPLNLLFGKTSIKKSYWQFPVITGILGLITFWFFLLKLL